LHILNLKNRVDMKILPTIFGILIGVVLGFVLAALFFRTSNVIHSSGGEVAKMVGSDWPWPDSLDSVITDIATIAPNNDMLYVTARDSIAAALKRTNLASVIS
jgi:hypothetical protein